MRLFLKVRIDDKNQLNDQEFFDGVDSEFNSHQSPAGLTSTENADEKSTEEFEVPSSLSSSSLATATALEKAGSESEKLLEASIKGGLPSHQQESIASHLSQSLPSTASSDDKKLPAHNSSETTKTDTRKPPPVASAASVAAPTGIPSSSPSTVRSKNHKKRPLSSTSSPSLQLGQQHHVEVRSSDQEEEQFWKVQRRYLKSPPPPPPDLPPAQESVPSSHPQPVDETKSSSKPIDCGISTSDITANSIFPALRHKGQAKTHDSVVPQPESKKKEAEQSPISQQNPSAEQEREDTTTMVSGDRRNDSRHIPTAGGWSTNSSSADHSPFYDDDNSNYDVGELQRQERHLHRRQVNNGDGAINANYDEDGGNGLAWMGGNDRQSLSDDPALDDDAGGGVNGITYNQRTAIMIAENNPASAWGDARIRTESLNSATASRNPEATQAGPVMNKNQGPATATIATASSLSKSDKAGANSDTEKKMPASAGDEQNFVDALKSRGLEVKEQDGDGNCLFRAISLQVYGDASMHGEIRKRCMDFMEQDEEHFSQFVTGEPFKEYIARKRQDGVHGNHTEIQAVSELFNRPIEVFTPDNGSKPLNIFHAEYKTSDAPIRLSYHDGNHYNAVIDPLVPTAGLGLGLPGLQPGLADKMQLAKAVAESDATADQLQLQQVLKSSEDDELDRVLKSSEEDELHRAIKESQLSTEHMHNYSAISRSDEDATYFDLEQAALAQSLRSYQQNEECKKQSAISTSSKRKQDDVVDSTSTTTMKMQSGEDYSTSIDNSTGFGDSHSSASTGVAYVPNSRQYASSSSASSSTAAAAAAASSSSEGYSSTSTSFGASGETSSSAYAHASSSSSSRTTGFGHLGESSLRPVYEYPDSVQELVMNGFPLNSVVKVMEIVGPSFDDMLALLLANQP